MRPSLSTKLVLATTMGIGVVMLVYSYLRVERAAGRFESDARRDHAYLAHALAVTASSLAERLGPDEALDFLEDINQRRSHVEVRWLDAVDEEGTWDAAAQDETLPVKGASSRVEPGDEHRILVTTVPVDIGNTRIGIVELREALELEQRYLDETILRAVVVAFILTALCALILLASGWVLIRRPMQLIVRKLHRIGHGDLSGPLELHQKDEMGMVARELNAMCERLAAARDQVEREIRARLAALEQLRHADRLGTVGRLASGVAHELGTPLNVVQARARMIADDPQVTDALRADAGVIVEQSQRMTRIIRQLLDFARRRSPRKNTEDLGTLARNAISLLAPLAAKSGVALEVHAPGDDPVLAEVDEAQMQQVLTNLLMNGIQAQPRGGAVRILVGDSARSAPSSDGETREYVFLTVEDDGSGMAREVRERIFEPFFTTKEVGQGTGLGLSVAYGIVLEHGGDVEVSSTPGEGSRFTIHLPKADPR